MKQLQAITLFLVVGVTGFGQEYLGSFTIEHKKCDRYSLENFHWKKKTTKNNTVYRNLEFDLMFDGNCEYVYSDPSNQSDCQKLVKLCTNQNGETKNSLRIGWYWNDKKQMIELAFYAHINHLEGLWGNSPGRELSFLNYAVKPGEWVHVKMAIGKDGMFMSIDDQAVVVARNVFSWSPLPEGETTFLRASSYFENRDPSNIFCKGALNEMKFHIANMVVDSPNFEWVGGVCDYTARNLTFMNSHFEFTGLNSHRYLALDSIVCSNGSASTVTRLPFDQPFTVIEPSVEVEFNAGELVKLKDSFIAKDGSFFSAKIDRDARSNQVEVQELPEFIFPKMVCRADFAETWTFELYDDVDYENAIFSEVVDIRRGSAVLDLSFPINNRTIDTARTYYGLSTLEGVCSALTFHHILRPASMANQNRYQNLLSGNFADQILVFPNPSNGAFFLEDVGDNELIYVNVFSLHGQLLQSFYFLNDNVNHFDISGLSKGTYILEMVSRSDVASKKIVIK